MTENPRTEKQQIIARSVQPCPVHAEELLLQCRRIVAFRSDETIALDFTSRIQQTNTSLKSSKKRP